MKDGEQVTPEAHKRKKTKATKLPSDTILTEDDYELIAMRMHDALKDSFEAMHTSQEKIQSTIEKQLLELKEITEKTAMIQVPPVKATVRESSTQSISPEEILAKDHSNTVLIPPGSNRFPASMMDVQIHIRQPVEVNLTGFPVDQL